MKNKLILSLLCSASLANIVNAEMVEPVGLRISTTRTSRRRAAIWRKYFYAQ